MIPPTSIDGTDITGATIDGTDVTEITVDGQTVFTAAPPANLVSRWTFDNADTSGNTAIDVVGNNDATINGATTGVPGDINEAYRFSGSNEDVIATVNIDSFTEYTFSVRVKTTQSGNSPQAFLPGWVLMGTGEDAGFGETYLYHQDAGAPTPGAAAIRVGDGSSAVEVFGTTIINDGSYHTVTGGAAENGDVRLFVDGTADGTNTIGTFGNPSSTLAFAKKPSTNDYGWAGDLDDGQLYNKLVDQGEASNIHTTGTI